MSGSTLRIVTDPSADYAAKPMKDQAPPATLSAPADIRRSYATSSYCMGVTDDAHADHLRLAAKMKELTGEPYSFQTACVSYMMDLDRYERGVRSEMPGKSDYVRIWGWSRKQLRSRWDEIVSTVEAWRTGFGRLKTGGQPGANQGPSEGQHTITSPSNISQNTEIGAGAPSVSSSGEGGGEAAPCVNDSGGAQRPRTAKPKAKPTKDDRERIAERIASAVKYPAGLDTAEVRAEFARWIYFRRFILPKAQRATHIAAEDETGVVAFFQAQIDHAAKEGGKYYVPGGAAGYVAALRVSRESQWRHPYADKDFKPSIASGSRDYSYVPIP